MSKKCQNVFFGENKKEYFMLFENFAQQWHLISVMYTVYNNPNYWDRQA